MATGLHIARRNDWSVGPLVFHSVGRPEGAEVLEGRPDGDCDATEFLQ